MFLDVVLRYAPLRSGTLDLVDVDPDFPRQPPLRLAAGAAVWGLELSALGFGCASAASPRDAGFVDSGACRAGIDTTFSGFLL